MRLAKEPTKAGGPYLVIPVEYWEFINFRELSPLLLSNTLTDENGDKVKWLEIKEVMFQKENPEMMYIKYKHTDTTYIAIPQRSIATRSRNITSANDLALHQLYDSQLPISKEKKADLLQMCGSSVIPKEYHEYYRSLPCDI